MGTAGKGRLCDAWQMLWFFLDDRKRYPTMLRHTQNKPVVSIDPHDFQAFCGRHQSRLSSLKSSLMASRQAE